MDSSTMLTMLEADLGLLNPPDTVETYMQQLLQSAQAQITGRGVTLRKDSTADMLFVASWAAWLYRKRDSGSGLPEMLLAELRSRLVAQVTAAEEADGE